MTCFSLAALSIYGNGLNRHQLCSDCVTDSYQFAGRWVWRTWTMPGLVFFFSAWIVLSAEAQGEKPPPEKGSSNRPPPRSYTVPVPLIVEKQSREDIQVIITTNRADLKFQAAPLMRQLAALLRLELLQTLQAAVDEQGNLRLQAVNELGLVAEFDEAKLELRVAVPPELRPASDIHISMNRLPPGAASALRPSDFSAYLNLRTGFDYVEQSGDGRNEGLQPFRGDLEGAVNLHHLVVEGSASYTEDAAAPWLRNDTRLVYDDPPRRIRYALGLSLIHI